MYILLSIVAALVLLLYAIPHHSPCATIWILLFILALPITVAGDFLGEALRHNRLAVWIENRTSERTFSWLRTGLGLAAMLLLFGVAIGIPLS